MKWLTRSIAWLLVGISIGVSLAIGQGVLAERHAEESLPLEDLRTFTEVFARIKNNYVEEVDDGTLLEHAIRGMLTGLDPHSAYLVPDDYQELQAGTSGEFGGLGIEVGMEDGFVKVIAPIDDTPAQRAGVEAGDLVIRLDDTPVKGMSLAEAVKLMRGEPGTDIILTIVREGRIAPSESPSPATSSGSPAFAPAPSSRDTDTSGSASFSFEPATVCGRRSASCAKMRATTASRGSSSICATIRGGY